VDVMFRRRFVVNVCKYWRIFTSDKKVSGMFCL